MNSPEIAARLEMAVTAYDRKESTKKSYNRYALGIYFNRIADIVTDVEAGADLRSAVIAGFNGRLADACLRSLGLAVTVAADARGTGIYSPIAAKTV